MVGDIYPNLYGQQLGMAIQELRKLTEKVDELAPLNSLSEIKVQKQGEFYLKNKANVVWWNKVDLAARYRLFLTIDSDEVCIIEFDRDTRFHVFEHLPKGLEYHVKIVAEDRNGKEISAVSLDL